ncbi:MAG: hypothetical protein ACRCS0_16295, partial [Albidovulum sp.]
MLSAILPSRAAKLAMTVAFGLSLAACAKNPEDQAGAGGRFGAGAGAGMATPGSAQDFAQNVGDR